MIIDRGVDGTDSVKTEESDTFEIDFVERT